MESPTQFFKRTTKLNPIEQQDAFLKALADNSIKRIAAHVARQCGKSLITGDMVLYWLFDYEQPLNVLILSPMYSYVYDHMNRIVSTNPDLAEQVKKAGFIGLLPLRGFELKNKGSRVFVRTPSDIQIRGISADIVICDEAPFLSDKIIKTAEDCLSGSISKLVLLGTPTLSKGLFYKVCKNPKTYGYETFHWSKYDCISPNWHSKELIELSKVGRTEQQIKTEIEGLPLDISEKGYYDPKYVEDAFKDYLLENEATFGEKTLYWLGIDLGYGETNDTGIVVVEKKLSHYKVVYAQLHKEQGNKLLKLLGKLITDYTVVQVRTDEQPVPFSKMIKDNFGSRVHTVNFSKHKKEMLAQLKDKLLGHKIKIPDVYDDLKFELLRYQTGKTRDDNLHDALLLATFETKFLEESPRGIGGFTHFKNGWSPNRTISIADKAKRFGPT